MSRPTWSTDELLSCAELLKAGKTSKEIALALGRSKGSVVGMVQRNADLKKIGFAHSPLPLTTSQQKIHSERLKKRDGKTIMYGRFLGKPLMQLVSGDCRFPLWPHDAHPPVHEQLFCAQARTDDSSYCEHHRKLCRAKPKGMH